MTGLVSSVLVTCMRNPTHIIILCDPEFCGGKWALPCSQPICLQTEWWLQVYSYQQTDRQHAFSTSATCYVPWKHVALRTNIGQSKCQQSTVHRVSREENSDSLSVSVKTSPMLSTCDAWLWRPPLLASQSSRSLRSHQTCRCCCCCWCRRRRISGLGSNIHGIHATTTSSNNVWITRCNTHTDICHGNTTPMTAFDRQGMTSYWCSAVTR